MAGTVEGSLGGLEGGKRAEQEMFKKKQRGEGGNNLAVKQSKVLGVQMVPIIPGKVSSTEEAEGVCVKKRNHWVKRGGGKEELNADADGGGRRPFGKRCG